MKFEFPKDYKLSSFSLLLSEVDLVNNWKHEPIKRLLIEPNKGFIIIHKVDFCPVKRHSHPWVVDLVYVVPEFRRKGLGKAMLEFLVTKGFEITCVAEPAYVQFYKHIGFENVAERQGCQIFQKP
jgi:GNAT superfamily N-acetyltransferase